MRLSKLQKAIEALDDDEECDSSTTEEFVTDFPASSDIKGSSEGISNKYELVVDCAMGEAAGKCSSMKIEQGERIPTQSHQDESTKSPVGNSASTIVGAPRTECDLEKQKHSKAVEWYGFVRLLIWVRRDSLLWSKITMENDTSSTIIPTPFSASAVTAVVPCGSKTSSFCCLSPFKDAGEEIHFGPYATDCSPDKGAVMAYFPTAKLLVLGSHLYGTNAYNVSEASFDKHRLRQMRRIEKAAAALVRRVDNDQKYRHISSGDDCAIRLPISRNYRSKDVTSTDISGTPALQDLLSQDINVVLAGDLNFRCEASDLPCDKSKAGKDWQLVEEVVSAREEGWQARLAALFHEYDRLHRLMADASSPHITPQKCRPLKIPLLKNMIDAVGVAILRGNMSCDDNNCVKGAYSPLLAPSSLRPTFSKPISHRFGALRPYATKRTPSWTDRILFRGDLFQQNCLLKTNEYRAALTCLASVSTSLATNMGHTANAIMLCRAISTIVSSDHDPVVAVLNIVLHQDKVVKQFQTDKLKHYYEKKTTNCKTQLLPFNSFAAGITAIALAGVAAVVFCRS